MSIVKVITTIITTMLIKMGNNVLTKLLLSPSSAKFLKIKKKLNLNLLDPA